VDQPIILKEADIKEAITDYWEKRGKKVKSIRLDKTAPSVIPRQEAYVFADCVITH